MLWLGSLNCTRKRIDKSRLGGRADGALFLPHDFSVNKIKSMLAVLDYMGLPVNF